MERDITITGTSIPDGFVVIFVNDNENIVLADADGEFSVEVALESGSNIISAYTVGDDGETHSHQITVIFSNKSLEENLVSDSEVRV